MTSPLRPTGRPRRPGPGWFAAVARAAAVAVGALVLALQAWAPGPGSPMPTAAARTGPLTCFAVDVSGSNLVASVGEPPSDPGPVFVRQQVVELFSQVLADLGEATGQQVGVVTFGTGPGTRIGPLDISAPAVRSELATALPGALRPSSAEAAWTNWAAGVGGCEQMFKRSGDTHGMVVLLTDGFPQGPAGGPAAQLAAIAPMAKQLGADGITIQPVLYGAGAGQPGPARQAMTRLAGARTRAAGAGRDAAGHAARRPLTRLAQHRPPARRVRVSGQRQHQRPHGRRTAGGRSRAGGPAQLQPGTDLGRCSRWEDACERGRRYAEPRPSGRPDPPSGRKLSGQQPTARAPYTPPNCSAT